MKKEIRGFVLKASDGYYRFFPGESGNNKHLSATLIIEEPETFESEAGRFLLENFSHKNTVYLNRNRIVQAMKQLAKKFYGNKS